MNRKEAEKLVQAALEILAAGEMIKQNQAVRGAKLGDWVVKKSTPKAVTIFMPSSSGRFSGKSYMFRWDGTGFKRQGQYLYTDGPRK